MPTTVLDDIPDPITAGDAFAWKRSLSDYPASAGWVLSYALVKSSTQLTLQGSVDGDDHLISKTAADTAGYVPAIMARLHIIVSDGRFSSPGLSVKGPDSVPKTYFRF